jgi:DNA-binding MarR family transcriptional regulator
MVRKSRRVLAGETLSRVVLSTLRANGLLLAAGDELAGYEGLTAARWQALGAVALADRPMTVPQIARRMGLTRQSVHVTVRTLVDDGLLQLTTNEDHARSALIVLTEHGTASYEALGQRQTAWVNQLAEGLDQADLDAAARVLEAICELLSANRA